MIVALLLAAGTGQRFDPSGQQNKLLQTLANGQSVIAQSARNLLALVPELLVVTRASNDQTSQALADLPFTQVVCPQARLGMGASLACGASACLRLQQQGRPIDGLIVALADMPFVQPATIAALLRALEQGAQVAAPFYAGQRGNPVAFNAQLLPRLQTLSGDQGARNILKDFTLCKIPVDDQGILKDIDEPHDLPPKGNP